MSFIAFLLIVAMLVVGMFFAPIIFGLMLTGFVLIMIFFLGMAIVIAFWPLWVFLIVVALIFKVFS